MSDVKADILHLTQNDHPEVEVALLLAGLPCDQTTHHTFKSSKLL